MNGQEGQVSSQAQTGAQPTGAPPHQAYRPLAAWPKVSWLAVAAMLSSILWLGTLLSAVLGLTLGIFALVWIKRSQGKLDGRNLAIYAVVVSALVLLTGVIVLILIYRLQMHYQIHDWWPPGL